MCQVNNSVIFSGKPIGPVEFLSKMVEALGIIMDRRPKGRPLKMESQTIEKNRMCPYLNKVKEEILWNLQR